MATRVKPAEIVDESQKMFAFIRKAVVCIAVGAIVIAFVVWFVSLVLGALGSGGSTQSNGAPTPSHVGEFTATWWLYLAVALTILGAITKKIAPAAIPILITITVILVGSLAWWGWATSSSTTPTRPAVDGVPVVSTATPQAEWLQLEVPGGGRSGFYSRPGGYHHRWACDECELVSVYPTSGKECVSRIGVAKTCANGSSGIYIRNLSKGRNAVALSLIRDE